MEGFYYVGNHNKKLFREVLDHLYYKHNCRSFVFAGGPDFHYENKMRFEAFKEAMADYNIPLTDDMYMFGDFDFGTGVRYIKEWHDKKYPLPGAFVCANDNIAAGMCSMAAKLGYNGNPFTSTQALTENDQMVEKSSDISLDGGKWFRVYDPEGVFIGVYAYDSKRDQFRPEKMFYEK